MVKSHLLLAEDVRVVIGVSKGSQSVLVVTEAYKPESHRLAFALCVHPRQVAHDPALQYGNLKSDSVLQL